MDLFAHGLWGGIMAKTANKKQITKKPISLKWFIFWNIIPDIFTFTILFTWFLGSILVGYGSFANLPHYQITEPMSQNTHLIINLTYWLYNFSHSLVVFLAVFAIAFLRKKSQLLP